MTTCVSDCIIIDIPKSSDIEQRSIDDLLELIVLYKKQINELKKNNEFNIDLDDIYYKINITEFDEDISNVIKYYSDAKQISIKESRYHIIKEMNRIITNIDPNHIPKSDQPCSPVRTLRYLIMERLYWLVNQRNGDYYGKMFKFRFNLLSPQYVNNRRSIFDNGHRLNIKQINNYKLDLTFNHNILMAKFHYLTQGILKDVIEKYPNINIVGSIIPMLFKLTNNYRIQNVLDDIKDIDIAIEADNLENFNINVDNMKVMMEKNKVHKISIDKTKIQLGEHMYKYKFKINSLDKSNVFKFPELDIFICTDIKQLIMNFHVAMVRAYLCNDVFCYTRSFEYAMKTNYNFDLRVFLKNDLDNITRIIHKYKNRKYIIHDKHNEVPWDGKIDKFIPCYYEDGKNNKECHVIETLDK